MPSSSDRTGSPSATTRSLEPALALARSWAGEGCLALIVSGSHANGDAVWTMYEGRPVSLSDLDLYAVVPDPRARDDARRRAREERPDAAARLALGLAAPLEVGVYTPDDLAHLEARPGSITLKRHGRVVAGDPSLLERVPTWTPADVSDEEILLLLENRAFELLWAECLRDRPGLAVLQRRHAVLKTALDLAGILALAADEYPDDAAARVAWARTRWNGDRAPEPPWDEALAWRSGRGVDVATSQPRWRAEWERTVRGWAAVWRGLVGDPGDPERPFLSVLRVAARSRGRRRLREAILPGRPGFEAFGPVTRLTKAGRGTPQHRLNASATAQLLWWDGKLGGHWPSERLGVLKEQYEDTMRALGIQTPGSTTTDLELFTTWDRSVLDGQRSEELES